MQFVALVLSLAAVALASDPPTYAKKEVKTVSYSKHETKAQTYHGRYGGQCSNDGFYYNNAESFVICSNGNAYYQNCAPGSRNSGYNNYNYGNQYQYRDFCDVNLVDYGYGAHQGYGRDHGYGQKGNSYGGQRGYGSYGYNNIRHNGYGYGDNYGHDNYGYGNNYGYNNYGYGDNYGHDNYGYGRLGYFGGYHQQH